MDDKDSKTSDQDDYYSDGEIERDKKYKMNSSKESDKSLYIPKCGDNPLLRLHVPAYQYCKTCNVYTNGIASWRQHKLGKRHALKSGSKRRDELSQDSYTKRKRSKKKTSKKTYSNVNKKIKLDEEINENNSFVDSLRKYDDNLSSCDKKSTKTNHASNSAVKKNPAHIFLRNTLKQVENHNRRYPLGKRPSTFVPERRSSCSTPEIVSVKDATLASKKTSSHVRPKQHPPSSKKQVPEDSVICLSDDDAVPAASTKPIVFELEKTLTTVDVFNLVLLKLKNIQFSKEELNLLTEVAEKSTEVSNEFKEKNSTVQENIPFINDVMEKNSTTNKITVENIPFIDNIMKENSTTHERTHATTVEPLPVTENSSSTADTGPNPSIILPDSVWINLPSVQDLDNIQSWNPLSEQDLNNILRTISDSLEEKTVVFPEYSSNENEVEIIFP